MLQESTVYAFHVPGINAIKVGFGSDGKVRMNSYTRQYTIAAAAKSLREWKLPSPSIASAVESACHVALLQADFGRIAHVVDKREAQELFDLGGHTYEHAVLVVAEAIEETINSLYEALARHKPLSQEKARQQKEAAKKRRDTLREEKRKTGIDSALSVIGSRWATDVEPFVRACANAESVYRNFKCDRGLVETWWKGNKPVVTRMREWAQWNLVKAEIPKIFRAGRLAKSFYIEMYKNHHPYAEEAARELGLSLWRPGGNNLPGVRFERTGDQESPFFLEIRLAVQLATGFGGEDAAELMKLEPALLSLVAVAKANPPPELADPKYHFF